MNIFRYLSWRLHICISTSSPSRFDKKIVFWAKSLNSCNVLLHSAPANKWSHYSEEKVEVTIVNYCRAWEEHWHSDSVGKLALHDNIAARVHCMPAKFIRESLGKPSMLSQLGEGALWHSMLITSRKHIFNLCRVMLLCSSRIPSIRDTFY